MALSRSRLPANCAVHLRIPLSESAVRRDVRLRQNQVAAHLNIGGGVVAGQGGLAGNLELVVDGGLVVGRDVGVQPEPGALRLACVADGDAELATSRVWILARRLPEIFSWIVTLPSIVVTSRLITTRITSVAISTMPRWRGWLETVFCCSRSMVRETRSGWADWWRNASSADAADRTGK